MFTDKQSEVLIKIIRWLSFFCGFSLLGLVILGIEINSPKPIPIADNETAENVYFIAPTAITPTETLTLTATPTIQVTIATSPTPAGSPTPEPTSRPANLIFPDAEVVYSPTGINFNTEAYLASTSGFMSSYQQYLMITSWTSAAEVIERVALENSISPRLLLALLEYQSGCVLGQPKNAENFETAMDAKSYYREDLYGQLVWAARTLSEGFYGWLDGTLTEITFFDGTTLVLSADTNAGTVALQYFFAQLYSRNDWDQALDPQVGFPALFKDMFGDPWVWAEAVAPLMPPNLVQPELVLPFEEGKSWAYTGGPHKVFESNGPLGALDFAPGSIEGGCVPSTSWVTAMADGTVVRSEFGVVIQDLDNDGHEQTGWALLYLHIENLDRVPEGTYLRAGEHIGHPSCEGGRATGTHVHIARKYNGVWIAADGPTPFVLDGWQAHAGEEPYLGTLTRGDDTVIANTSSPRTSKIIRQKE